MNSEKSIFSIAKLSPSPQEEFIVDYPINVNQVVLQICWESTMNLNLMGLNSQISFSFHNFNFHNFFQLIKVQYDFHPQTLGSTQNSHDPNDVDIEQNRTETPDSTDTKQLKRLKLNFPD